jgi:hypothetical protein
MDSSITRIGATTFRKMTRISAAEMRALEAVGILTPLRSDSGWRSFEQRDVEAVNAWRAEQAAVRAARVAERAERIRSAGATR